MKHLNSFLFSVSVALLCCTVGVAQDAEPEKKIDSPTEMLSLEVLVTDPDGNPVEEAIVKPYAMRTKAEPASHWSWIPKRHGEQPKVPTNADGIAVIPFPKYTMEKIETGQVTLSITHPEFIPFTGDQSVESEQEKSRTEARLSNRCHCGRRSGRTNKKRTLWNHQRVGWSVES